MTPRPALFTSILIGLAEATSAHAKPQLPSATLSEDVVGVYAISDVTRNEQSCATEGPSVLEEQSSRYFVLKNVGDDRFGHFVYAVSCYDPEGCQQALKGDVGGDWIWMFSTPHSPTEFSGEQVHTGMFRGNTCSGPRMERIRLEIGSNGAVTLSIQASLGEDYSPEPVATGQPPSCHSKRVRRALEKKPCDQWLVIRGALMGG